MSENPNCYHVLNGLYNSVVVETFMGMSLAIRRHELIYKALSCSQSCCHASLIYSESCSLYVVVPGSIALVCLSSAVAKHFCSVSFVACHHHSVMIVAIFYESPFRDLIWHDTKVGMKQDQRSAKHILLRQQNE